VAPTGATDGTIIHGTALALDGQAVLLRGPAGAGKSDLALRALGLPQSPLIKGRFELVADDQVVVHRTADGLTVAAPAPLKGLIEVRGVGIVAVASADSARLVLLADLTASEGVERLPDPWPSETLLGVRVPVLRIAPLEASAPLKLALALAQRPWEEPLT
jgi:serine kinase of HPr protein (carbohydrate metabolism regulator)